MSEWGEKVRLFFTPPKEDKITPSWPSTWAALASLGAESGLGSGGEGEEAMGDEERRTGGRRGEDGDMVKGSK